MADRPGPPGFLGWLLRYGLPVVAYVCGILTLSAQPYLRAPIEFRNSDKLYHTAEYFVLGVLLIRAIQATTRIPRPLVGALIAIGLGVVVATGDEYLQKFVPGRESSVFDGMADTLGLVIAQLAYFRWLKGSRAERT
jgi:VanZ family protein